MAIARTLGPGERMLSIGGMDEVGKRELKQYIQSRMPFIQELCRAAERWVAANPGARPEWQDQGQAASSRRA